MADLTLRGIKGIPLSNEEVDANFTNLNTEIMTHKGSDGSEHTLIPGILIAISDLDIRKVSKAELADADGTLTTNGGYF